MVKSFFETHRVFFLSFGILSISFFLIFLAYFPGLFSYDVGGQLAQRTIGYNLHHPLLHTLYLQFFYYDVGKTLLGNVNGGVAIATLVQMLLFAACLAYMVWFVYKEGARRVFWLGLLLFFALAPFFSVLSISLTKDTFFAGVMGLFALKLYEWECHPERFHKKRALGIYVALVMAVILLRNNGIYPLIVMVLAGCLLLLIRPNRRKVMRVFLVSTVIGIVVAELLGGGLKLLLHAQNGSKNEMFSIPYQQMARVYNVHKDDTLSEEEKSQIITILPDAISYVPWWADPVKAHATAPDRMRDFINLYIYLGRRYEGDYIKAWYDLDRGFIDITDKTHAKIYGHNPEDRQGYLRTDTIEGYNVEHTTYFPLLESVYEKLYSENMYQRILPLRIICSPALYMYILFGMTIVMCVKRRPVVLLFVFVWLFIATVLAGPCCLIRYALPYICMIPAMGLSLCKKMDIDRD